MPSCELPKTTPSKASNIMIPNSEQQSIDRVNLSQFNNPAGSKQYDLLEVINNFCGMQATVVTLVMSVSLILDKLNKLLMLARSSGQDKSTNTPHTTPPPCYVQPSEGYLLNPKQFKLNTGCINELTVPSAASAQPCKGVTSWRRSRLSYIKVFEMKI